MVLRPFVGSGMPGVIFFGCWNLIVLEPFGVLEPSGGSGTFMAYKHEKNEIHFYHLNGQKIEFSNTKTKM